MKRYHVLIGAVITLLVLVTGLVYAQGTAREGGPHPQDALGTAFTYQGRLSDEDGPVDDACDLTFALYDAAADGTLLGTVHQPHHPIVDGYFTVQLDFGTSAFGGDPRWLDVQVQCSGDADYVALGRQALTPAPYALYAASAPWTGLQGVPPDLADGDDDIVGGLSCTTGQIAKWNGSAWLCAPDDDTTYTAGAGLTLVGSAFAADAT